MSIIEEYNKVKRVSLFKLIPPNLHESVLEDCSLYSIKMGNSIVQKNNLLYIVTSGEVQLSYSENNKVLDIIEPGRSIEFSSYLNKSPWKYKWTASDDSHILLVPRQTLDKIFSLLPSIKKYLQNITHYEELHKLKRDYQLIGIDDNSLYQFFENIQTIGSEEIDDVIKNSLNKTLVISSGEMRIYLKSEENEKYITSLYRSDYLIIRNDIRVVCSQDFRGILLTGSQDSYFIKNFTPVLDKLSDTIEKTKNKESIKSEQIYYEDNFEYEDNSINIEEFKPDKNQIKKHHKKKFYFIKQNDMMDCGAACMAMISRFYGKKINIATWRSLIYITREGASMLSLKNAANQVGFDAMGVMSGYKSLQELQVPFIALMQSHYVVIYKVSPDYIWIADPSSKLDKVSRDEFKKSYSHHCLLIKPNSRLANYPNSKNNYGKYLNLLKGSYWQFLEILLASILLSLLNLGLPLFLQLTFDNVLLPKNQNNFQTPLIMLSTIILLAGVLVKIRGHIFIKFSTQLSSKLNSKFFKHILKLPLNYFEVRNVGDITSRLSEINQLRDFFSLFLLSSIFNIFSLLISSGILYYYHPHLFLISLIFIPFYLFMFKLIIKTTTKHLNTIFKFSGISESLLFEQITFIKTLKSIGAMVTARWRWEESFIKLINEKRQREKALNLLKTASPFASEIFQIILFFTALGLFLNEALSFGQVIAVYFLAQYFLNPLDELLKKWNDFDQAAMAFGKIDEILTSPKENINLFESNPSNEILGDIICKNVTFQYGSDGSPLVLKNIDLEIPRGKTIAFVGQSGSGKSTLSSMINRLYTPIQGDIYFGETHSKEIPLENLRKLIKTTGQDSELFSGTIIDNITLGDENPHFERAVHASKMACAHDFIVKKRHGYYYQLGPRGLGLSGGQRQRLCLARVFYSNPEILILDEATSSLDEISEKKILNNIRMRKGKTNILIAHRLNTIIHADKIVVFQKGQIVEEGTHQELLLKRSHYFRLFKRQIEL
ncbi:MAG: ATP-binding cassette domain-containing protein [Halobacteriovoraceae bacterium]|nr:ATP-binding cassette domain-containing protein [Halobacteriovoraceae bacterium]MCB9095148.1 ATP-binding cassette domain-containing protein [Halobacteriovoraceae bacterium]